MSPHAAWCSGQVFSSSVLACRNQVYSLTVLLVSAAVSMSSSWSMHRASRNPCKSTEFHPFSKPIPLHCTKGTGWDILPPASSMSLSEVCTSSRSSGGMHLNCSLKGSLLLMWILCSITLMHPSLFPSSMKMSLKAKMSSHSHISWSPITEAIPV